MNAMETAVAKVIEAGLITAGERYTNSELDTLQLGSIVRMALTDNEAGITRYFKITVEEEEA